MHKVTVPQTIAHTRIYSESPCICRGCSESFKSPYAFDKHWRGKGKNRLCVSPDSVGMVIKRYSYGTVWV